MLTFSTPIQLIIESCKTTKEEELILSLISKIEDWEDFIDLAHSHGVFPLVYHTLKYYKQNIPDEIYSSMKSYNMKIVKQNMLMTAELIKTMKLLEDNGIEAISFKGPTLSQMAYGDIALRQYCDLDILVKKENIYKIYKLLKNSHTRSLKLNNTQENIWFKYAHDLGLTTPNNVHIEFHWLMLDSDHPISLKSIDFFGNNNLVAIQNSKLPIISNEKFLIYLCIHGSKHMFERIEWAVDIDKFIRTQNIDWDILFDLIKYDNSIRFFLLGLYMSNTLYNTPIENKYSNLFDDDIIQVYNYITYCWSQEKEFNNKRNLKFLLKLFVSLKDKIQYLNKIYLKPTFNEYWYISFPKPLYFLYYPLRQYLLIKKYFFNKK